MDIFESIKEEIKVKEVKGVIFDFDGTIADIYVQWNDLRGDLKKLLNLQTNLGINASLRYTKDNLDNYMLQKAYNLIEEYELKYAEKIQKRDGVIELIEDFYNQQIKLAIFSNNMRKTVNYYLKNLSLDGYFDIVIAKDDVSEYKPNPEGIYSICKRWGLLPNQVILIGNDDNDQLAGDAAGITTFLINK